MKILIWGVPCVGKATVGKLLAEKLGYKFFDVTDIIKEKYGTIDNFHDKYQRSYDQFIVKRNIVYDVIENNDNFVMVISLIYIESIVRDITDNTDTLSVELIDSAEAIYNRITFYDENDKLLPDSKEYRDEHRDYYMEEVRNDQTTSYLEYAHIPKFDINNRKLEDVIDDLKEFIEKLS